ncbi:unnamed protein product [Prunus brigantina]
MANGDSKLLGAQLGVLTLNGTASIAKAEFSDIVPIRSIIVRPDDDWSALAGQQVRVGGWVKTARKGSKGSRFLQLNDGSCLGNLQVFVEADKVDLGQLARTGICVVADGVLKLPPGDKEQKVELKVEKMVHVGPVDPADYPLPKTSLPLEFVRNFVHLRPRTCTISSVIRIRSALAHATHIFFLERGFLNVQTPIMNCSDCEGAGEMFQVTTLFSEGEKLEKDLLKNPPPSEADVEAAKVIVKEKGDVVALLKSSKASKMDIGDAVAELKRAKENLWKLEERSKLQPGIPHKEGKIDYTRDFFGRPTFLTVSGQLQLEAYACSLSKAYSFGPTFRAEKSHTTRHLAEFWMVEPEMAFAELEDDMNCAEAYVKFMCEWLLEKCHEDMEFFAERYDKSCIDRLRMVASTPFERITYTEAVDLLIEAVKNGKEFENHVEWGIDLSSEHERYLTEVKFQKPVIVYNYPKDIKAFYMRLNDDFETVAAMDVLVPKVGELIGGSQREERFDVLQNRILERGLPVDLYQWYLDLRRFGTVKHSGFGLGFERMVMFATGLDNIKDCIPNPRIEGRAD